MRVAEEITISRKNHAPTGICKFGNPAYVAETAVPLIKNMAEFEGGVRAISRTARTISKETCSSARIFKQSASPQI
jgi:hypothetical protein